VALAWAYVLLMVLTRALPAVLPGQDVAIPGLTPLLESLPGGAAIERPPDDHRFNRPVTILVLGADRRPDESELTARTDTIVVLRLDPATRRASALSVPRDLWVTIDPPGGSAYAERINASYQAGALSGGSIGAGARQVMHDLDANFGIEADHYIWVDIRSAASVIDALGGVEIEIPEDLAVPDWYYTDDDVTNPVTLAFPPGKYHLDGYRAVAFARYRNDSDLLRAQRQQLVVQALLRRVLSVSVLRNPFALWRATAQTLKSDLPGVRLAGLGLLGARAADGMLLLSLGDDVDGTPTVYPVTAGNGASVLEWDAANVARIVDAARATR
jgi:LCP family protein required for cell wall assembly